MYYATCELAFSILNNIFDIPLCPASYEDVRNMVYSWYNCTDITNPYILAAAVIKWGYFKEVPYQDIIDIGKQYFPIQLAAIH